MIALLLKILSVIGIVLLCILGLLLAVILLVLFVPVCYRADGAINETKKRVQAKVTWFGFLVRIYFRYPEEPQPVIRILWKKLASNTSDGASGRKSKGKSQEKQAHEADIESIDPGKTTAENMTAESIDADSKTTESAPTQQSDPEEPQMEPEPISEDAQDEQTSLIGKIRQKIENIIFKIRSVCDKIKEVWENVEYYLNVLGEEDTKRLLTQGKKSLYRILRNIRPRVLRVRGVLGMGSPDTTGYLYGVYCMFLPVLGSHVEITPDFERQIVDVEFRIRGHITLFVLLINGLRILLNRRHMRVLKKFKSGGK